MQPPGIAFGAVRSDLKQPRTAWLSPIPLALLSVFGLALSYVAIQRTPVTGVSAHVESWLDILSMVLWITNGALAIGALAVWKVGGVRAGANRGRLRTAVGRWPAWLVVLPVSLAGSTYAARMALNSDPTANYWPAFTSWLAAVFLLVVSTTAFPAIHLWRPASMRVPRPQWRGLIRSEVALVITLTVVALVLRAVNLAHAPILIHGDEEQIGADAFAAASGHVHNMFGIGWGANPSMGFFLYGAFLKVLGGDIVSLRFASAVFGAAAVPALYLLLREMFGRAQALTGTVFLIGYALHLHFSRVGVNVIWDTPTMAAALYAAYRASKHERAFDFAMTGAISGFAVYLYHGTRVVPIVVAAYFVYLCAFRWRFFRNNATNLALAVAVFMLALMPIGAFYVVHPHAFWARLDEAGIFQSGWYDHQREAGRSAYDILWGQTKHAFGGWFYYPDNSPFVLYPVSKPLVRGLAVVPLVAGIVYALLHLDDRRYALLLLAFAVPTFVGGTLTVGPPNAQRLFGAIPAVVGLITVGLWQSTERIVWGRTAWSGVLAVVAAGTLAVSDARTYFDAAANDTRWGALVPTEAIPYVNALPEGTRIYWYGQPLVTAEFSPFSLRGRPRVEVYDSAAGPGVPLVTQPGPAVFMFMPYREARLALLRDKCPGGIEHVASFRKQKLFTAYELLAPNECVPDTRPPDDFTAAVPLTSLEAPIIDFTRTFGATLQAAEPQPCGLAGSTVWYVYTPAKDGTLRADTNGSTFDTVLAVYTGASIDALSQVVCNDDDTDLRSRLSFDAIAGKTYYFQIGTSGKGKLTADDIVRFNLQ